VVPPYGYQNQVQIKLIGSLMCFMGCYGEIGIGSVYENARFDEEKRRVLDINPQIFYF